jgi:hypothetical protein
MMAAGQKVLGAPGVSKKNVHGIAVDDPEKAATQEQVNYSDDNGWPTRILFWSRRALSVLSEIVRGVNRESLSQPSPGTQGARDADFLDSHGKVQSSRQL